MLQHCSAQPVIITFANACLTSAEAAAPEEPKPPTPPPPPPKGNALFKEGEQIQCLGCTFWLLCDSRSNKLVKTNLLHPFFYAIFFHPNLTECLCFAEPTSAPLDLFIEDKNDTSVTIIWSQPEVVGDSGLDGYTIEICKDGSKSCPASNQVLTLGMSNQQGSEY